jgi:hypothetical protein
MMMCVVTALCVGDCADCVLQTVDGCWSVSVGLMMRVSGCDDCVSMTVLWCTDDCGSIPVSLMMCVGDCVLMTVGGACGLMMR